MPVVGVSRNKTLLVDSGQDSVVLAQAFDCSRFPLVQGESFSDLSCLTCAHRAVRLASSVSNSTSPCNERTWNALFPLPNSPLDQRPVHRLVFLRGYLAFASVKMPPRKKKRSCPFSSSKPRAKKKSNGPQNFISKRSGSRSWIFRKAKMLQLLRVQAAPKSSRGKQ